MNLLSSRVGIPDDPRIKGRVAALTGGFLLSFDSVFIRLSGVGGVDTAFLFGLFSAFSMAVAIMLTDKRGLVRTLVESGWPVVVSALLIVGSASSMVLSIKHTTVADAVFIISARPVFTALASWIILREKTSKALWLAIAGVMAGIFIVTRGALGGGSLLGDGFALFAVLCLGVNGALWRRYKAMSRFAVVGLGGLFIALVMFVPASPGSYGLSTWLVMAGMGLFSAPLGRTLNALSSRYIPAAEMAALTLVSAVLAPIWAYLFFMEKPPVTTLAGGAVILASIGSYLVMTGRAARRKRLAIARQARLEDETLQAVREPGRP